MTEKEKARLGLLYDANYDEELLAERRRCKELCFQFNQLSPLKELEQRDYRKTFWKNKRKFLCNSTFLL